MKASIQDQIRDYAVDVTAQSVAVDLDEITEPKLIAEPVRPPYAQARPAKLQIRPWRVAAASAVAVLVLVGGVAWLVRTLGPETPVAATPPNVSSTSLTWSRVPHSEEDFGDGFEQVMDGVTAGGPGLVAVGQAGPGQGGEGRAAVWTSVDGLDWSRVPHNEAVFGRSVMHSVTAGGPGLVAVGTSDQAAVWTSPDGFVWSRVSGNEPVFSGANGRYISMSSVTAGGPGLVAVGIEGHPHGANVIAVVWTSVDGLDWSRVPHDDAVFGEAEDGHYTEMQSVTVGGPGLVAVGGGWSGVDGQEGGAVVWTSVDGVAWSRVPHDDALFGESGMSSVTVGGPGLVAVGGGWSGVDGQEGGAAVWTSADGINWSRVPHDDAVFGGAAMDSVTAGGPGLVVIGWDDHPQGGNRVIAVAWTSVDGITWSRVPYNDAVFGTQKPHLPVLEVRSITASGSRLVAVGANKVHDTFGATRGDAAVWVADWD